MEAAAPPAEQMSGGCSLSEEASGEECSKPAGQCRERDSVTKTDLASKQLQGLA